MTLDEFEAHKNDPCRCCGLLVELETDPQNKNRVQVVCSNALCPRKRQPWGLVVFIKMSRVKRRRPYAPDNGLYDVWERNGNVCWFCGAEISFLVVLNIPIERHHPLEYAKTGHDGPIIPVCEPCHQYINLRQREVQRWKQRLADLNGESVPGSSEGVFEPRVSPDPVRATREAPLGGLEGLSADDAHH